MENHNNLRRDYGTKYQIGLESARVTTWWTILVFDFFVLCTEANTYPLMKYLLKLDDTFMNFINKLAEALIHSSYINDETCGIPSKTIKIKISHILETEPTHATEYDEINGFVPKFSDTNNKSSVGQNVKNEHVACVSWEP